MAILEITKDNFEQEVLQATKPVLIDFLATWCGPCRMMAPVVEEIAAEAGDSLIVGKVNVDEAEELAVQYGVSSIPTLMLFKDGKQIDSKVGVRSKEDILAMLG